MNPYRNFLNQPEISVIGFDLNNLCLFGPIIQAMLGQGAKGAHPRSQRNHNICLSN